MRDAARPYPPAEPTAEDSARRRGQAPRALEQEPGTGCEGAIKAEAAGWGLQEATLREELASRRTEAGNPGARDFMAAERLCSRCHGKRCFPGLDDEGKRDVGPRPGRCLVLDGAWRG